MTFTGEMADLAPEAPRQGPVCAPGEFVFAAVGLAHGHIYGMTQGLLDAGATLKWVYDDDEALVAAFREKYPQVQAARSEDEVLEDEAVKLIASADVPARRCPLGCRAMEHGKDFFADKAPMTTLEQLAEARAAVARTGRKYAVYYGERIGNEGAVYAGQLIDRGILGRVVQVLGLGPHRHNPPGRAPWFYERASYGGILIDIGSHQAEQFLHFTGAKTAEVLASKIANYHNPDHPEFDDFGDATILGDNGATGYFRVDWLSPAALPTWGDARTVVLGTKGYLEIRKTIDVARENTGNHVYVVTDKVCTHRDVTGKVGLPYCGQLIRDCLDRTETAMTQERAFAAAEISLRAQAQAVDISRRSRGS